MAEPRALIIDDSPHDAERVRSIIEGFGWEAVVCGSAAEAAALIASSGEQFGAALVLWEIAGRPFGSEIVVRCRARWPGIAVLVVSGALDARLAASAAALGAHDFLEKPIDSVRLKTCLGDLMQTRDPLLPWLQRLRDTPLGDRNERLCGESPAFLAALRQLAKVIQDPKLCVLLTGESGTGKELLAQAIHRLGPNSKGPWVAVDAGAIPPTLLESELFGHEKGSFTDAREQHRGYLEQASGGALFLDEIGNLDLLLQGKLLRVTQEKEFRRVGGSQVLKFSARLVCATNRDLPAAVLAGEFRRDLFYRISEVTVHVPPLRDRQGDLALLLNRFLAIYDKTRRLQFARETLKVLHSYPFPGNVRELENIVRHAVVECEGDLIRPGDLPLSTMEPFLGGKKAPVLGRDSAPEDAVPQGASKEPARTVLPGPIVKYRDALRTATRSFDREYFAEMLKRHHYNLSKAARAADLDAKTFRKHWKACGLGPLKGD